MGKFRRTSKSVGFSNKNQCTKMSEYNMSNSILTEQYGNGIVGWIYIIHTSCYMILYIPCLLVITKKPLIENSCFKIMACMAIPDIAQLLINGTYSGIMSVMGVPFLPDHLLHQIIGSLGISVWWMYCSFNILLAFNRYYL